MDDGEKAQGRDNNNKKKPRRKRIVKLARKPNPRKRRQRTRNSVTLVKKEKVTLGTTEQSTFLKGTVATAPAAAVPQLPPKPSTWLLWKRKIKVALLLETQVTKLELTLGRAEGPEMIGGRRRLRTAAAPAYWTPGCPRGAAESSVGRSLHRDAGTPQGLARPRGAAEHPGMMPYRQCLSPPPTL